MITNKTRTGAWLSVAGISLLGGMAVGNYWIDSRRPRAELSEVRSRLGSGAPLEILDGAFRISNAGRTPLQFSISSSCSCTDLEPTQGSVAAADSELITFKVRLPDSYGTPRRVRLAIKTNDPRQTIINRDFFAECPSPITVSPNVVDFGTFRDAETSASPAIIIRRASGANTPISELIAECDSSDVLASIQRIDADEWRLHTALAPGLQRDTLTGTIAIRAPEWSVPVPVKIRGTLQRDIRVAPSTVYLSSRSSHTVVEGEFFVWRGDGRPLPRFARYEAAAEAQIEELTNLSDDRRRFKITCPASAQLKERTDVKLFFDGESSPIAVAVRGAPWTEGDQSTTPTNSN